MINFLIGAALFGALILIMFVWSLIYAVQETLQWRKKRLESIKEDDHSSPY